MQSEILHWLGLIVIVTGLLWLPYILNSFVVRGIMETMGYREDLPPLAAWAVRAKRAHYNAVENLVLFGPILVAHAFAADEAQGKAVVTAAMVYLIARVLHYIVYILAIPVARTLTFAAAWVATLYAAALFL